MNRPERLRASDVAYSSIRQGLAAGRWAPGSHLRESELAAELGISRTPVREALRKLASEQLVSFEPHLGVRVPGWSNHDIEEIFALRVELESYAAGQAARHATPAQVAELRELAGQIEKAAFGGAEPDYVRITELNNRFHSLIVVAAANQRLVSLVVSSSKSRSWCALSRASTGRNWRAASAIITIWSRPSMAAMPIGPWR